MEQIKYRILPVKELLPRAHGKIVILDFIKEVHSNIGKNYEMLHGYFEDGTGPICLPIECFELVKPE